ncbi:MAG: 2-oxoglutarate dehydrogenase complex dihydrolipoyllysine-residue succinyltransferase [Thioalkalivibrionaceae bacterium]
MSDLRDLKVPALPESVSDATVAAIHKRPGDAFARDEVLIELETDKVLLEVPAPEAGQLESIDVAIDDVVSADQVLARYSVARDQDDGQKVESASRAAEGGDAAAEPESNTHSDETKSAESDGAGAETGPQSNRLNTPKAGPGARRAASEKGIDLAAVSGTGPRGRISTQDVYGTAEHRATQPSTTTRSAGATAGGQPSGNGERRESMTRIRRRIAERLVAAQHNAAMLTTFNEVDMSTIIAWRSRHQEAFVARHDIKLGFMSFFVRAAAAALAAQPVINARIEDDEIVHPDGIHIGIAVSTPRGLIVPVLRHADRMDSAAIEKAIRDVASRGREGRVTVEEMQGGTFSITNGGIFGSLLSTPILNAPQSAILGMHTIQERPIAVDGQVVIRPMMYLALSYDHRLIDGEQAVKFLVHIKQNLEDPARLLLAL